MLLRKKFLRFIEQERSEAGYAWFTYVKDSKSVRNILKSLGYSMDVESYTTHNVFWMYPNGDIELRTDEGHRHYTDISKFRHTIYLGGE